MIHLPLKDIANPPGRLSTNGALKQLRRAVLAEDGNIFNSSYYPDNEVKEILRALSLHKLVLGPRDQPKCYYCESQVEEGLSLRVEHYRPEAKLDGQDNGGVDGLGYYWLGLEWTNLLLSCEKCNQNGAKGSRFPVRGIRNVLPIPFDFQRLFGRTDCIARSNPLILEEPLLLNPEIDHPEEYLTFDHLGYIAAHGPDPERGETTWQILELNRDTLIIKRSAIVNTITNRLNMHILCHQKKKITSDGLHGIFKDKVMDLLERKEVSVAYTLWGRYINDHLQECILDYLPAKYQAWFMNAYQETLNELQL